MEECWVKKLSSNLYKCHNLKWVIIDFHSFLKSYLLYYNEVVSSRCHGSLLADSSTGEHIYVSFFWKYYFLSSFEWNYYSSWLSLMQGCMEDSFVAFHFFSSCSFLFYKLKFLIVTFFCSVKTTTIKIALNMGELQNAFNPNAWSSYQLWQQETKLN